MKIANHTVVSLDYTLTDEQGQILDQSAQGQFVYLHGARNIIPGLENALTNKQAGETLTVVVEPADGYGEREDALRQVVPLDMFESTEEIVIGQQFHAQSEHGHPVTVTVVAVDADGVTVDGNHPLAGKQLHFDVSIVEVRAASAEEIEHGHVHTPGHHHH